jgi:hypothetical protein
VREDGTDGDRAEASKRREGVRPRAACRVCHDAASAADVLFDRAEEVLEGDLSVADHLSQLVGRDAHRLAEVFPDRNSSVGELVHFLSGHLLVRGDLAEN